MPEWIRRTLPPGATALLYGGQLGTGFLTRFTFSTHLAFVALLATQSPPIVVAAGLLMFACTKAIVVVSSLGGSEYKSFERQLLYRHRSRAQSLLRGANAALALATATVLIVHL